MNHTTEAIAALDVSRVPCRGRGRAYWLRRIELQRSVRPVTVLMTYQGTKDSLQMLRVEDQQPIEILRANGPHKSLRDPVR